MEDNIVSETVGATYNCKLKIMAINILLYEEKTNGCTLYTYSVASYM